MKKILLTGLLLCLVSSTALAAGFNLIWSTGTTAPTQCNGVVDQSFACDNNDGPLYPMLGSFQVAAPMLAFFGLSAIIDGQSQTAEMPMWWQSNNSGLSYTPVKPEACRNLAFSSATSVVASTVTACYRLWTATANGGIGAWQTSMYPPPPPAVAPAPNRLRIKIGYAMTTARVNLVSTRTYNAFSVTMDASKTVYVAPDPPDVEEVIPCAGCEVPLTLVLNQMDILGNAGALEVLTDAISNRCITWQGGAGGSACDATPARNTTWGNVKSLYR